MLYVSKVYWHITYEHVILAKLPASLHRHVFSFIELDKEVEETWALNMLLNKVKGTLQYGKKKVTPML
jgi:hypothetical protein